MYLSDEPYDVNKPYNPIPLVGFYPKLSQEHLKTVPWGDAFNDAQDDNLSNLILRDFMDTVNKAERLILKPWSIELDHSQVDEKGRHRVDFWHQDGVRPNFVMYLWANRDGTEWTPVDVKETIASHQVVEPIYQLEPGVIYRFSPFTWHRSPLSVKGSWRAFIRLTTKMENAQPYR